MTQTEEARDARIGDSDNPSGNVTDALQFIDAELGRMLEREVVAATEVSDLLLDLRVLLAASPEPTPVP